jgi:hypothetical protein
MAWTSAAPLVRQPHDQGLDRVLDVLLRDPLPGVDQRVPGPGPHVRQADRVDPVCHPARAPHVLPFHSGLAGLFPPGHAELSDMYSKPICALDIARRTDSIRRSGWIALLLHYVINPARRLTTYNRRYVSFGFMIGWWLTACITG